MRGTPYRFVDFRGGLNTKAAPYLVAENECRDCQNIVSTVRGSIKKRNGNTTFCSTFSGSPGYINSLFGANVGATVLMASGGTKLYSISTSGVATDITGGLAPTNNVRWAFAMGPVSGGQGPIWMMNGTDVPEYWTGTGNVFGWSASVGSVPNGQHLLYFKNRMWVAGVSANPSRLYFSDLGDPRSWTATNVVDLDPNDGQTITGIGTVGSYLIVFKQTKAFIIYDLDTGANRVLSSAIGCIAPRTIFESPIGTFFLSSDKGLFLTNGSTLKNVSDNIFPTLLGLSASAKANCAGVFLNDHYYLSIPYAGAARNTVTLDYDTTTQSWWKHSNTATQFALWRPSSSVNVELYAAQDIASPIVDKCYVDGIYADNASAFNATWTGPWLSFKAPYIRKRVRQIHIDGKGAWNVDIGQDFSNSMYNVGTDIFAGSSSAPTTFGGTGNFGGTGLFGDPGFEGQDRIFTLGVARSWSIRFSSSDVTDGEVDAYTMAITPRKN